MSSRTFITNLTIGLLVCSSAFLVGAQPQRGKSGSGRVQRRTYDFKEAGKAMEYALFVPSSYDKDKKTPLLVALHGLGGNPQQMIRSGRLTALAEKYGYIVVAPMGYNSKGWYGARGLGGTGRTGRGRPSTGRRGAGRPGAGRGRTGGIGRGFGGFGTPPGTVLSSRVQENLKLTDKQKKKITELQKNVDATIEKILNAEQNKQLADLKKNTGRGGFGRGRGLGGDQNDPPNLGELSEKDVMNVLKLVRKEFAVDEKRIYLIGHSMGGAGTWHLGTKYADIWAGLAPIAPAAFGRPTGLDKIKHIPVIVVQGDNDTLVRPEGTRRWVAALKEQKLTHEYLEIPGAGHGDVISRGMPRIFEFFEKHKKKD